MIKGFLGFIAALGLLFAIFGVFFIFDGLEARSWPSANGEVVSTRVQRHTFMQQKVEYSESRREARRTYYPEITYRWTVDGQSYTGSRWALGESHPDYKERPEAEKAAAGYPSGMAIDVYYDPADPSQPVLDRSLKLGAFVPLPLGLLFLAAGIVGLRFAPAIEAAAHRGAHHAAQTHGSLS
jgi:hypothetical protein